MLSNLGEASNGFCSTIWHVYVKQSLIGLRCRFSPFQKNSYFCYTLAHNYHTVLFTFDKRAWTCVFRSLYRQMLFADHCHPNECAQLGRARRSVFLHTSAHLCQMFAPGFILQWRFNRIHVDVTNGNYILFTSIKGTLNQVESINKQD